MSGPLRSKQGCWTCRLRKKKCDERRPHCTTCTSLSITCYGYGSKPEWMDNGDEERAVAHGLKEIVKYTSRRKPIHLSKHKRIIRLAPKGPPVESVSTQVQEIQVSPSESGSSDAQVQSNPVSSDGHASSESKSGDTNKVVLGPLLSSVGTLSPDTSLLMHFLDIVFPLQYPMYKPGIMEGGRGWLLDLLLQTKPLYHAALALSSYHVGLVLSGSILPRCGLKAVEEQQKHLELCLIEVRNAIKSVAQFVEKDTQHNGVGIVASIVQLVFFELFAGQGTTWLTHLNAAVEMYRGACEDNLYNFRLHDLSKRMILEDLSLMACASGKPLVAGEVAIFRFQCCAILWLEAVACITTGTAPRLLSYYKIIADRPNTKVEGVVGCKSWAIILIGRIAALQQSKGQSLGHPELAHTKCVQFDQAVLDIQSQIEYGLVHETLTEFDISGTDHHQSKIVDPNQEDIMIVTRVVAHTAAIYLHLVIQGFQNLERLDNHISSVVAMVEKQIPKHLLTMLIAPLFIVGSVARQGEEQQFFQQLFKCHSVINPLYKHRAKIPPILEEIWKRREWMAALMWDDVLDLSRNLPLF